jgi:hypothetical protein
MSAAMKLTPTETDLGEKRELVNGEGERRVF